jgi:hypothetical protein
MTNKAYAAFIASLGVALALVSTETFGLEAGHGAKSASTHSGGHPSVTRTLKHHKGRNAGVLAVEGSAFGPWNWDRRVEITQPVSGDIHYTFTYEPLWDAAHRYAPALGHYDPAAVATELAIRPFVPGCPTQTVTVPSGDGKERTISIIRCY